MCPIYELYLYILHRVVFLDMTQQNSCWKWKIYEHLEHIYYLFQLYNPWAVTWEALDFAPAACPLGLCEVKFDASVNGTGTAARSNRALAALWTSQYQDF